MMSAMRGFGMRCVGDVGWLERPRPECGPLDAIVRPTIVAPCTSDVRVAQGWSTPRTDRILGHEAVGIVDEVGPLVTRFRPGDLVAIPCVTPNWLAPGVQRPRTVGHDEGEEGSFKFVGVKDGVMAEFCHVNHADANLALIPDGVAPEAALMATDMMPTGLRAVEAAEVGFGDTVVVVGIGPVGLMAVAGAVLRGAGRVIAVGTRPAARALAVSYGATEVISYRDGGIADQVLRGDPAGVDAVIIAGGDAGTLAEAVRMVRPGGIVSNVNFYDQAAVFHLPAADWGLGMADKDIRGSFCPGGGVHLASLLAMIRYGRLDPTRLITHTFHGMDHLPDAFSLMERKPDDLIKPIVYLD